MTDVEAKEIVQDAGLIDGNGGYSEEYYLSTIARLLLEATHYTALLHDLADAYAEGDEERVEILLYEIYCDYHVHKEAEQ